MSKSPLSGAFAGSSEPAKKNKKNGALLLISGIALATSIGGVFAANTITINSNADIEFGQGVANVSTCVDALTFTATQVFVPQDGATAAYFKIDALTVTGDFTDCVANTDLVITARKANGDAIDANAVATVTVVDEDAGAGEVLSAAAQTITINLATEDIEAGLLTAVTATTE